MLIISSAKRGLDAWYDKREIIPGENWAERIAKGLKESDAMVVLLTPNSLDSDSVRLDIDFALSENSYNKRLIPVIFGEPAKFPSLKVPWIFNHLKTVRLPVYGRNKEHLKQIANALKEFA